MTIFGELPRVPSSGQKVVHRRWAPERAGINLSQVVISFAELAKERIIRETKVGSFIS